MFVCISSRVLVFFFSFFFLHSKSEELGRWWRDVSGWASTLCHVDGAELWTHRSSGFKGNEYFPKVGLFIWKASISCGLAVSAGLAQLLYQCLYPAGKVTFSTLIIELRAQSAELAAQIFDFELFFLWDLEPWRLRRRNNNKTERSFPFPWFVCLGVLWKSGCNV